MSTTEIREASYRAAANAAAQVGNALLIHVRSGQLSTDILAQEIKELQAAMIQLAIFEDGPKCADCDAPAVRMSAPEYSAGVDTARKPRCERHAHPVAGQ